MQRAWVIMSPNKKPLGTPAEGVETFKQGLALSRMAHRGRLGD
jgi:hypothetical protein